MKKEMEEFADNAIRAIITPLPVTICPLDTENIKITSKMEEQNE